MKSFRLLVVSFFVVAVSAAYAAACSGSSCGKDGSKDSKGSKEVKVEEKKG